MTDVHLETVSVLALFSGYLGLWKLKRIKQKRATGLDPEVLGKARDPVQAFFARAARALTLAVVALIAAHATGAPFSPWLARDPHLDGRLFDVLGLTIGAAGLALCWVAQTTMGHSWRVGIDDRPGPGLVTTGIYSRVRNPTYLGLYLVNAGLFLIWPTPVTATFGIAFYLLMELQVRCEESQLLQWYGDEYQRYSERTWRYLPWIY